MIIDQLTEESINHVFADLWGSGGEELRKWGWPAESLKEFFLKMIGQPFTCAFKDKNQAVCAVIALEPTSLSLPELNGGQKWRTFFAATESGINRVGVALTKFLRKFSDEIAQDGRKIIICSAFGEGNAREWFEAMGFRYNGYCRLEHYYIKG